jgi:hypothetical protein
MMPTVHLRKKKGRQSIWWFDLPKVLNFEWDEYVEILYPLVILRSDQENHHVSQVNHHKSSMRHSP